MKYRNFIFSLILGTLLFGFTETSFALRASPLSEDSFDCIPQIRVTTDEVQNPSPDRFCDKSKFKLGPNGASRFANYLNTLNITDAKKVKCIELLSQASMEYYSMDCDAALETHIEDWRNSEMTSRQKFDKYAIYILSPINAYVIPFLLLTSIILIPLGLILCLFIKRRPVGKKLALYGLIILISILIFWIILNVWVFHY